MDEPSIGEKPISIGGNTGQIPHVNISNIIDTFDELTVLEVLEKIVEVKERMRYIFTEVVGIGNFTSYTEDSTMVMEALKIYLAGNDKNLLGLKSILNGIERAMWNYSEGTSVVKLIRRQDINILNLLLQSDKTLEILGAKKYLLLCLYMQNMFE